MKSEGKLKTACGGIVIKVCFSTLRALVSVFEIDFSTQTTVLQTGCDAPGTGLGNDFTTGKSSLLPDSVSEVKH